VKAEIISIGTELLLGQRVDTNASYIAEKLASIGIDVYYKSTVGDNKERLLTLLKLALSRSEIIITTGGLGPTMDDLTIEAIAEAMEERLVLNKEVSEKIEAFFRKRNEKMPPNNIKQALIPQSAKIINNPIGTAPGIILEKEGKIIIAMPGVSREMKLLMENSVISFLKTKYGGNNQMIIKSKILKTCGISESGLEVEIKDLLESQSNPTIAMTAHPGEIHIRVTAKTSGEERANNLILQTTKKIKKRLGKHIFGEDDQTIEDVVASLLLKKGITLGLADVFTSGLVFYRLINSSSRLSYFLTGVVSQRNLSELLENLQDETVNSQTAIGIARGIKIKGGNDLGLAIIGTFITQEVASVYIALVTSKEEIWKEFRIVGNRSEAKYRASQMALDFLRRYLLNSQVAR